MAILTKKMENVLNHISDFSNFKFLSYWPVLLMLVWKLYIADTKTLQTVFDTKQWVLTCYTVEIVVFLTACSVKMIVF